MAFLAAPAFKVKLYVPFARPGLALLQAVIGNFHVMSYVKGSALTHDPERATSYATDPLIRRPISVKILLAVYTTSDRIIEDAQAIRIPTQLLISGSDWVVHRKPQYEFFERLGSSVKEKHEFPGFYHDTLGEKDRLLPIGKAREFILKTFADAPEPACLLDADKSGYTNDEFDALSRPASPLKALNFALTRLSMRDWRAELPPMSIRLGLSTGFPIREARSITFIAIGPRESRPWASFSIDWFYLNAIGWRGIRVRKQNIERLLTDAMSRLRAERRAVRIVDIAAGHGRYVLDAVEAARPGKRDSDASCATTAMQQRPPGRSVDPAQKGLESIARFEAGDAFDRASLATIRPRPTLGIVSGLYELFPDNGLLRNSLAGLADAIEPGGYLIYTGQPWHPQLEMIARTLPSHRDHKPWVMRRRTQAEMDQLVEAAAFRKIDQFTDDWGIFTVSMAQRMGA